MSNKWRWCLIFGFGALLGSCGDDGEPTGPPPAQQVAVVPVLPDDTVVAGGSLFVDVLEADLLRPSSIDVILDGEFNGNSATRTLPSTFEASGTGLRAEVSWATLAEILPPGSDVGFTGVVGVVVHDLGGSLEGIGEVDTPAGGIHFVDALRPVLHPPTQMDTYLHEATVWEAEGLLRPGEGQTELVIDGTFTPTVGTSKAVSTVLAVDMDGEDRTRASVRWEATAFGVRPGTFSGTVTPRNTAANTQPVVGDSASIEVTLLPTEIDGFSPPAAGRGEIMTMTGRGFIPSDAEAGQSMFLQLEGSFVAATGDEMDLTGANVLRLIPDVIVDHDTATIIMRTEIALVDGREQLVGLSARPGTFTGTVTPILVDGADTFSASPFEGTLEVLPTHQYIWVRFLPGFTDALNEIGLGNVAFEVRQRIFEICARDYDGLSVTFGEDVPDSFAEFSTIEVGGPDPNGAGLFGLDNTAGKDTGNLRLNDYVGGENADSGDLGYYVFGGVFVESFVAFSPSLPGGQEQIASPRFDDILAPFWFRLGGVAIDANEWPDGPRADAIELAIHMVGSVIGNTITHEIGHSLGLSFFDEDYFIEGTRFHNDFDEDASIMDSGGNRPFEERAEIDGFEPGHFNERNMAYLRTIVPGP